MYMYYCGVCCVQGKDCTVFFVSIAEDYKPIGFVRTPSPVTKVQWSAPGREEVCMVELNVLCVHAPLASCTGFRSFVFGGGAHHAHFLRKPWTILQSFRTPNSSLEGATKLKFVPFCSSWDALSAFFAGIEVFRFWPKTMDGFDSAFTSPHWKQLHLRC